MSVPPGDIRELDTSVVSTARLPIDNPKLRLDAQYQSKSVLEAITRITRGPHTKLGQLANGCLKGRNVAYDEDGEVPIIRSGDVSQFLKPEALLRSSQRSEIFYVNDGDVLISSIGFGSIGKVQLFNLGAEYGTVGEVTVVRQQALAPSYVAAFLASSYGQMQIERLITGATGQLHLYPGDVDLITLPLPSDELQRLIELCYTRASTAIREAVASENDAISCLQAEIGLAGWRGEQPLTYSAKSSEAVARRRLDAQFFAPRIQILVDKLSQGGGVLSDVASARRQRFDPELCDTFNYIEIGDIEAGGTVQHTAMPCSEAPSRATWYVRSGDVITSTVRPIRRLSAIIGEHQSGDVCSSGFVVLQPKNISAEVLLTYLRLPAICELLDLFASASMYPAITEGDVLQLPMPLVSPAAGETIKASVQNAFAASRTAHELLAAAKGAIEQSIQEGEQVAFRQLTNMLSDDLHG